MASWEWIIHDGWPRWASMWMIALAIYAALKILTWAGATTRSAVPRQLAYLLAWPGMDADAFLGKGVAISDRPRDSEWLFAVVKMCFGLFLLQMTIGQVAGRFATVWAWVGGVGIVFLLHFGLFHLLACLWSCVGWRAVPIMNWPIAAESLGEFWGRRWNLAFRDVTHKFLFRPLRRRIGGGAALFVGFLASGLIHDLVLSVPAGGGWGLPTIYFVIQGVGVFAERSVWGKRMGCGRGITGRLFCAGVLLVPLPLLLHPPFIERVLIPFFRTIGRAL